MKKGRSRNGPKYKGLQALERLFRIAMSDTGQPRRVANFLLAWHNTAENGGWDPIELWNVDDAVADNIFSALRLIRDRHAYAEELGFRSQMQAVWERRRGARASSTPT